MLSFLFIFCSRAIFFILFFSFLGRTGPGNCYRLYTEDDFEAMADFTPPEIHRVPLDTLLLQMIAIGLPDARKFPFLESPPTDYLENTIQALKQHVRL